MSAIIALKQSRCPDCGKVVFQERAAVRPATKKEIQDLLRTRAEVSASRNSVLVKPGLQVRE